MGGGSRLCWGNSLDNISPEINVMQLHEKKTCSKENVIKYHY